MFILVWESVVVIHQRTAFRLIGLSSVVMVAGSGTMHKIIHHLAIGSDTGSRYSDRIYQLNLSNPGLWLFLKLYNELKELYF